MTTSILRLDGAEAYDLIYGEHLSTLGVMDQETIHRTMRNSSRVWLGLDDDKVLCVYGLIPPTLLSDRAYLWLYTTKHFTSHVFVFVRHSQRVVAEMLQEFPTIVGHGHVGSAKSLRWLRWLGAEFHEPQGKFIPFEIKASQWQPRSLRSA